jgi:hypothetical protein
MYYRRQIWKMESIFYDFKIKSFSVLSEPRIKRQLIGQILISNPYLAGRGASDDGVVFYIAADHCSCTNDSALPDGDSWQNDSPVSNPRAVTDLHIAPAVGKIAGLRIMAQ